MVFDMETVEHRPGGTAIVSAAGAALAAAAAGGVVWGLIARSTDYEVGLVAWAIGWLAGTAAVIGARGGRGVPLQIVAVVAGLLGILLGKYLSFALVLQDFAEDVGAEVGLFSSEMRTAFRDDLGTVFGWIDLLFVGLAVYTAWRVGMARTPERPPARESRDIGE
jgi:hypothetical protein